MLFCLEKYARMLAVIQSYAKVKKTKLEQVGKKNIPSLPQQAKAYTQKYVKAFKSLLNQTGKAPLIKDPPPASSTSFSKKKKLNKEKSKEKII